MKTFGIYLKAARMRYGDSQGDLARYLKYHPQFISNWERGMSMPPVRKLDKIVKRYRLDPNETIVEYMRHKEKIVKQALRLL